MKIEYSIKIIDKSSEFIDVLRKKLLANMMIMEGDAKRLAPVDTGRLRTSIHLVKISDLHYEMRDGVFYGVFQEFGTTRMSPQPFFRPALEMFKVRMKNLISK